MRGDAICGGRDGQGTPAGGATSGVDATTEHLMDVARRLDVPGRSKMSKDELVDAIQKANDRETRKARS